TLVHLRDGHLYAHVANDELRDESFTPGQPSVPEAPRGLKPELVRPLLGDPDAEVAAHAGYLLALLGDVEGLPLLLGYWRRQTRADDDLLRLVYRAVAALGDDGQVRVLEEVYRSIP